MVSDFSWGVQEISLYTNAFKYYGKIWKFLNASVMCAPLICVHNTWCLIQDIQTETTIHSALHKSNEFGYV